MSIKQVLYTYMYSTI